MPDYILLSGDEVQFLPTFGPATVMVRPAKLQGSGAESIGGKKVCVAGDERMVSVPGCAYMTPQFSIPGTGTLMIESLAFNHKAIKKKVGGKPVLLKGGPFIARFTVQSPALQPPAGESPAIPDPTPQYMGQGIFHSKNLKIKGV